LTHFSALQGINLGCCTVAAQAAERTGASSGDAAPSAEDLIEGHRLAFLFGGGLTALGVCIALFVVRRDECEEAASKLEDPEEAAAFLAQCRQASRM
jgi:hypothetical protein